MQRASAGRFRGTPFRWIIAFTLLFLLAPAGPATAKPAPPPVGHPVLPGIWALDGIDPQLPLSDLEPLRQIVGPATVVGLGESIHTSGGFYLAKHRLFRYLVEKLGFRAFAMEVNWDGAAAMSAYVANCQGAPEDAMGGFFGVWQSTEVRDLMGWMCEWNTAHPRDRITFFGFDIQQPGNDAPALAALLAGLGIGADDPRITGLLRCSGAATEWDGKAAPEADFAACIAALDGVDALFADRGVVRTLKRQLGKTGFTYAQLRSAGLRAWELEIGIYFADDSASNAARDRAMASTFLTLKALRAPRARTAIWAHNFHVAKASPAFENMGSHLAAALGRQYAVVGLTAFQADLNWPSYSCGSLLTAPDSVENPLHDLGRSPLLIDLTFPGGHPPFLAPGVSFGLGDGEMVPRDQFNGLLYLDRSPRMTPLDGRTLCP